MQETPDQPAEPEETEQAPEPEGPGSQAAVSDAAEISVVDPEDQE